jgi:hypothetical protein
LREALRAIALALGGRTGARLTGRLAEAVSRMTLIRLVRAPGAPHHPTGCPFAPADTGDIAPEDVLQVLHRSGVTTGLDMEAMAATSRWLAGRLGDAPPRLCSAAPVASRYVVPQ